MNELYLLIVSAVVVYCAINYTLHKIGYYYKEDSECTQSLKKSE